MEWYLQVSRALLNMYVKDVIPYNFSDHRPFCHESRRDIQPHFRELTSV